MSKVYEALQYSFEGLQETKKILSGDRTQSSLVVLSSLPPLRMETEMVQLQHRIAHLLPDTQHRVIQFLSCTNQEGVTSIAQEFSRVLVEKFGNSVLLIDGDSKTMGQHQSLGIKPKVALQKVLSATGDMSQALTSVIQSRLFLALYAEEGSEVLAHHVNPLKQDYWHPVRKSFDTIVIDSAPMDSTTGGLGLCGTVDGVLIVVEAEKTRSHAVAHLKNQVGQNGGTLLGVVFNKQHHYIPDWLYRRL